MTEYEIGEMWTDARVQRIYGGTNEIMKELIARRFSCEATTVSLKLRPYKWFRIACRQSDFDAALRAMRGRNEGPANCAASPGPAPPASVALSDWNCAVRTVSRSSAMGSRVETSGRLRNTPAYFRREEDPGCRPH